MQSNVTLRWHDDGDIVAMVAKAAAAAATAATGYMYSQCIAWDLHTYIVRLGNQPPFQTICSTDPGRLCTSSIIMKQVTNTDNIHHEHSPVAVNDARPCSLPLFFLPVICFVSQSFVTHGSKEGQLIVKIQNAVSQGLWHLPRFFFFFFFTVSSLLSVKRPIIPRNPDGD